MSNRLLSLFLLSNAAVVAQTQWTRVDAAFPFNLAIPTDANRLCAAPGFLSINLANSTYLVSTDQGLTWQSRPIPGAGRGNILCFGDAAWTTTQVVGSSAAIQKSSDGVNWDTLRVSPANALEVNSSLGGNGRVLITRRAYNLPGSTSRLTLHRSSDGGQSWTRLADDPYVSGNAVNQNLIAPLTASAASSLLIPFVADSTAPKALDISTGGDSFVRSNFGTTRALFNATASTNNFSFFAYSDANLRAGIYRVDEAGKVLKSLSGVPSLGIATSGSMLLTIINELNSANTPTTAPVPLNHPRIFFSNDEGTTWWDLSAGLPRLVGTNSSTITGFGFAGTKAYLLTGPAGASLGLYTNRRSPHWPRPHRSRRRARPAHHRRRAGCLRSPRCYPRPLRFHLRRGLYQHDAVVDRRRFPV